MQFVDSASIADRNVSCYFVRILMPNCWAVFDTLPSIKRHLNFVVLQFSICCSHCSGIEGCGVGRSHNARSPCGALSHSEQARDRTSFISDRQNGAWNAYVAFSLSLNDADFPAGKAFEYGEWQKFHVHGLGILLGC